MATMVSLDGKPVRINSRKNGIEFSYDGGCNWSTLVINQNAYGDLTDIQINGNVITATTQLSDGIQRPKATPFKKVAYVAKR